MLQYVTMACVQIRTHKHKGVQHRCMLGTWFDTATGEQTLRTGNRNLTAGGSSAFLFATMSRPRNRDSVVGVRTRLRAVGSGVRNRACASEAFLVFILFRQTPGQSGAHPTSYLMGARVFFPGAKLPDRDFDHSPPYCAEVKNEWRYTSALLIRLHDLEREKFTSYLLQDRLWDPPRLMPSGYNEPRVLYPGIHWLVTAVNLM